MSTEISKKHTILLILLCHVIAQIVLFILLASESSGSIFSPEIFALIFMFPIGLYEGLGINARGGLEDVVPFIGYFIYGTHIFITMFLKSNRAVTISLAILVILLILNISGCREILDGLSNIT